MMHTYLKSAVDDALPDQSAGYRGLGSRESLHDPFASRFVGASARIRTHRQANLRRSWTETDCRIREHFKRSAARGNLPARPTASGVAFSLFCDAREVGCLVAAREKLSAAGVMLYSASALPRRRRVFRGYSEFASGKSPWGDFAG